MSAQTKDHYDAIAPRYDRDLFSPRGSACERRTRKALSLLPDALRERQDLRILELGAGTGLYTRHVNLEGAVVATDVSHAMLAAARKRLDETTHFAQCDATRIPFADTSLDVVLAFACLHHVDDTPAVFAEVARTLKPGGAFVLMEPNPLNPLNIAIAVVRSIERGMLKSSPARWRREAESAGLETQRQAYGGFFPGWPANLGPIYAKLEAAIERIPAVRAGAIFGFSCFVKAS